MKKNLQNIRYALLCILLTLFSLTTAAQEQLLLGWQFFDSKNGGVSAGDELTYNSSLAHDLINPSVLTRGAGLKAYALQRGFSSVPDILSADYSAAYTGNSFFQFVFKPKLNTQTTLTALNYKVRLAGTWSNPAGQPLYYQWKYSKDGGQTFLDAGPATSISAATIGEGAVQTPLNLASNADLSNLTPNREVVFRLYVWGFTNKVGSGTFALGRSASATDYSLSLFGTVSPSTEYSNVYFTDLSAIASGKGSDAIINKLTTLIDGTPTGESIHMSIYMINRQDVMDALKAAESRGVNLKIIVDISRPDSQVTNAESLPWLQSNLSQSEVITSVNDVSSYAINHHKFVLFSSVNFENRTLQNVTFQTSHNFTNADTRKVQDALIFNNTVIYNTFLNNWTTIKTYASSGMGANFVYNTTTDAVNGVRLDFFPKIGPGVNTNGDNIIESLNAITNVSDAKIRIAMSDWTDSRSAIVDKLIALRNGGATIEVYAKDAAGTQVKAKLNQLKNLGATVRVFNLEQGSDAKLNIHAKMMLIEGTFYAQSNAKVIITGSHNYTEPALKTNNEVLLTLINSPLFSEYNQYFASLKTVVPTVKLVAFDLNSASGPSPSVTSSYAAGIKPSLMTRGSGLSTSALNKGFSSSKVDAGTTAASFAEAMTRNDYIELPLEVRKGKKISLEGISAVIRRTAGGSSKIQWTYVLNNGNPTPFGPEISVPVYSNGGPVDDVIVGDIQDLKNITTASNLKLRLYIFGETSAGGTFAFGAATTEVPEVLVLKGDLETIPDENIVQAWSAGSLSGMTVDIMANNVAASVQPAIITRGAGLEASSLSSGFSSRTNNTINFNEVTDLISAEEKASYLAFSIDLKPNHKISLSALDAKLRRSGAGADTYLWKYSLDGTNFNAIGSPTTISGSVSSGVYQPTIDLSAITDLQNIETTVQFRLYIWGATSAAGSFALGLSETASEDVLVVYGTSATLPIELTNFHAKKVNNSVNLTWTTVAELNNDRFELQRSNNGKTWITLTTIKGAGNSNAKINYSYTDNKPYAGLNYYQLKQVDFDGKSSIPGIATVQFSINPDLHLSANYNGNAVMVSAKGFTRGLARVSLYNLGGQIIAAQNVEVKDDTNQITLPISLTTGLYVIKMDGYKEQKSIKLIAKN